MFLFIYLSLFALSLSLFLFVIRKKRSLCFLIFIAILFILVFYDICPVSFTNPEEEQTQLTITTYNIYPFADSNNIERWEREMIKEIKRLNPDILCLQEFPRGSFPKLDSALCSQFKYGDVLNSIYSPQRIYSKVKFSNSSNYRECIRIDTATLLTTALYTIRCERNEMPFYSIDVPINNTDTITIFTTHFQSNGLSYLFKENKSSIGKIYNRYVTGLRLREWEAKNLRHYADSISSKRPMLIVGDMNDITHSCTLDILQSGGFRDAWVTNGIFFGYTYHGYNLYARIDHVLYNNKVTINNIYTNKCKLSDHYALTCKIIINNIHNESSSFSRWLRLANKRRKPVQTKAND